MPSFERVSVFWGRMRGIRCGAGDVGIERVCGGLVFSFLSHFFDPGGGIGGLLASEGLSDVFWWAGLVFICREKWCWRGPDCSSFE